MPEIYKKKILIGATENEIIAVEVRLGDDHNRPESQYLAMSADGYDRDFFDADVGESRADDYLDEDTWRDAVANKQTTVGFDDWKQDVLNIDGWESILGDVYEVKDGIYTTMTGGGQHQPEPAEFVKLAVSKQDFKTIWDIWTQWHLKTLHTIPKPIIAIVRKTFDSYPAFKVEQLAPYAEGAEDEETD